MPSARDRLIDAFESLLVEHGTRAATLDAVAAAAEVSKGGLLYHFPNKDALIDGMLDRLGERGAADAQAMIEAPEGAVEYYLRTSTYTGSDFDRAMVAAVRIAQDRDPRASETIGALREGWLAALTDELGDVALARGVELLGDGLYYNAVAGVGVPDTSVEDALALVRRLRADAGREPAARRRS